MRCTRALIKLDAIKYNISLMRKQMENTNIGIMAIVKANAYGHGLVPVAKAAVEAGCSHLGVAIPEEGIALRESGIKEPILVLGLIAPEQAGECIANSLTVTVFDKTHLSCLIDAAGQNGVKAKIALKSDTGMHRIGADNDGILEMAEFVQKQPLLSFDCLFTHFASAGGPDLEYAKKQEKLFAKLVKSLEEKGMRPPLVSACASGGMLTMPESRYDLVRAGISMYGLYPSDFIREKYAFKQAMSFVTQISHIKKVEKGTPIGYEMTWSAETDVYIATLPVGYGDGYSRLLSNKGYVLIGGEYCPIAGNICMDQMMVCLGEKTVACVGDEAVLVGSQEGKSITFEDIATLTGTINYELACAVAARVPRIYI